MWLSAVVRKAVLLLNLAKSCSAVVVVQVIEQQNIYSKEQKYKLLLIKPRLQRDLYHSNVLLHQVQSMLRKKSHQRNQGQSSHFHDGFQDRDQRCLGFKSGFILKILMNLFHSFYEALKVECF